MSFGNKAQTESLTAPRRRPSQGRAIMTVDAILEAAAILFARDGFEASSTTRIAQAAGVSVGSLYEYFPSKDALVAKLLKRHCDKMIEQVDRSFRVTDGQVLERVIDRFIDVAYETYGVDARLHCVLLEHMGRVSKPHHMKRVSFALVDLLEQALLACGEEIQRPNIRIAAFLVESTVETLTQRSIQYAPAIFETDLRHELKVLVTRYLSAPDKESDRQQGCT
jgi:AcrR family transcriptional regulator